jgi:hypothetical protein
VRTDDNPKWKALLLYVGTLLCLGIVLPLVWDSHDVLWGFRVLGSKYGRLPTVAVAYILGGVALGVFCVVRAYVARGRVAAIVMGVLALGVCVAIYGWKTQLIHSVGGTAALVQCLAGAGIVAGLVMALLFDDERGYRVAAAAGVVAVLLPLVPVFHDVLASRREAGTASLWSQALAAIKAPSGRDSALPLLFLGAGTGAALLAVSLLLPQGRRARARLAAWTVALVLVMGSSVAGFAGRGVAAEQLSTWLGMVVSRFAPAAVILAVAVAEVVSAGRPYADSGARERPSRRPARRLDALELGRGIRFVHARQRGGSIDASTARSERVALLRAAVSSGRTDAAAAAAVVAEVGRLESDGVLSAAEAQSVRDALTPGRRAPGA